MAGSLQIAAPTTPNPTNTITNTFATGGGADGIDSAATAVIVTAEAAHNHKWANDSLGGHFISGQNNGARETT